MLQLVEHSKSEEGDVKRRTRGKKELGGESTPRRRASETLEGDIICAWNSEALVHYLLTIRSLTVNARRSTIHVRPPQPVNSPAARRYK